MAASEEVKVVYWDMGRWARIWKRNGRMVRLGTSVGSLGKQKGKGERGGRRRETNKIARFVVRSVGSEDASDAVVGDGSVEVERGDPGFDRGVAHPVGEEGVQRDEEDLDSEPPRRGGAREVEGAGFDGDVLSG